MTNLVELQRIEQIVQLSVLGALVQTNKVLLKSVKGQLLLVIDVNLERLIWTNALELRKNKAIQSGEHTLDMNFLQVGRTSLLRVAENIMTCLW